MTEQLLAQSEAADDLDAIMAPEVEGIPGAGPAANDEPAEAPPSRAEVRAQAEASAQFIIATAAAVVRGGLQVELAGESLAEGEQRLAAVLVKYDGELPPWLTRWQEEMLFGWWLATTGYGVYRAHLDHKAEADNDGAQSESFSAHPAYAVSGADGRGEVASDETEFGAGDGAANDPMG